MCHLSLYNLTMNYKKIGYELAHTKEKEQASEVKKTLLSFISELELAINLPEERLREELPFAEFIEDADFIFGVEDMLLTNQNKPDLNVSTNGLLAELLEACSIDDGKRLADELKDSIFALHSGLSKGKDSVIKEIQAVHSSLDKIKKFL